MVSKKISNKDNLMLLGYDRSQDYMEKSDVGNGAWVLVKCKIPVDEMVRPQIYGIYWAIPHKDKYNRQMCKIYTPQEVCLLNYEYTVISEERLQEYREDGYYLKDFGIREKEPLNMKLILKGRSLCEEEREIIWSLMLDGLTEQQACEEYYYSHHTDYEHRGCCYLPTPDLLEQIIAVFGENGIAG